MIYAVLQYAHDRTNMNIKYKTLKRIIQYIRTYKCFIIYVHYILYLFCDFFHFRFHAKSLSRMRQLLIIVSIVTIFTTISWTTITFFGESVWKVPDPETFNQTMYVSVPRLMLHSWYPWDASHGLGYIVAFVLQVRQKLLFYLDNSRIRLTLITIVFLYFYFNLP